MHSKNNNKDNTQRVDFELKECIDDHKKRFEQIVYAEKFGDRNSRR